MPKRDHSPKRNRQHRQDLSSLPDPTGLSAPIPAELPEGWTVARLEDLCEQPQYGYTAKATDKPIGPKMLRITDIQEGRVNWQAVPYCECDQDNKTKYALRPGDIVFARTGSVGKSFLISQVPEEAIFASYLIRVRVLQNLDAEFCYFFMQSAIYWKQIFSHTHGAVQPNVNATQLRSLLIPLPPLPEQRAIARVLSTIQRAIETQDKLIAAARALKRALMRHLFTYGAVPPAQAERVPLKETEVGLVPKGWEVVKLGDLAEVKYGKANPKSSGNVPIVGSGGIFAWTDKPLIEYPTIIVGRKGTAGEIHLADKPSYPSDTTFYLVWKKQVSIYFLFEYLCLHKPSGEHAKTTLPSLQRHVLENLVVTLPPESEQRAIARILSTVDKKIAAEEKRKAALQTLFKTMLHKLMTGQIRVAANAAD